MAFFPTDSRVEPLDDMAALFRAGKVRPVSDRS